MRNLCRFSTYWCKLAVNAQPIPSFVPPGAGLLLINQWHSEIWTSQQHIFTSYPWFSLHISSVHGLSHMSLLTYFPESLLYCTLSLPIAWLRFLINFFIFTERRHGSGGGKHISACCGSFLTTFNRMYRADWRSDNRLLPSILVFFFARFWFFTRFSFPLPRCRYIHES
jgi:hypothetical protein